MIRSYPAWVATFSIPDKTEVEYINAATYTELTKGIILPETKAIFLKIIDDLKQKCPGFPGHFFIEAAYKV